MFLRSFRINVPFWIRHLKYLKTQRATTRDCLAGQYRILETSQTGLPLDPNGHSHHLCPDAILERPARHPGSWEHHHRMVGSLCTVDRPRETKCNRRYDEQMSPRRKTNPLVRCLCRHCQVPKKAPRTSTSIVLQPDHQKTIRKTQGTDGRQQYNSALVVGCLNSELN